MVADFPPTPWCGPRGRGKPAGRVDRGEDRTGRLAVTAELTLPGHDEVFALGDAAAVPDLAVGGDAICPPTAQHALRQGRTAGNNVAARLRGRSLSQYRHRDLGLVVDLGGLGSVARPLGIPLSGLPAQLVTRGYHLLALPTLVARIRVATNWMLHAVAGTISSAPDCSPDSRARSGRWSTPTPI